MSNLIEWSKKSNQMFNVVADEKYLLCADFKRELYELVMIDFISSKISKTDFSVLYTLIDRFLIIEDSLFKFESFVLFIQKTDITISKPNLSRALKSLELNEFIEKVEDQEKLTYLFKTEYKLLESLS
ncbi:hypothetical protein E2R68_00575 [Psychromonas sp. RZ22]|uniref:hypothetical protein n=1 Tax=Psychromonas algarum TaxID=2555643 RepID=UPI001068CC8C|nr:hypothetical protein [Psychromonas sp. RZ22]TEW56563.1 hypothetical protein E2R68_00575 [Psychromonas sp. RZ22]